MTLSGGHLTDGRPPTGRAARVVRGRVLVPGDYFMAAIWIRLPQVSSKTAVTTGP
ncbi:hypothetical protein FHR93_001019 [Geodermatophilus sabuli]|uniref:Uncharacterized protein n=1 Tax=Geodermatophilus sabuli TaxID=1564158 RepID=A0A285E5K9_9ACTN|nr:hypothetical protein [Geodermatophilus sabuli]SNX94297.1 hypothetical protein SAMN06893097_10187 [Geodermatophilus sabuli]